jgi:hypothetical protein
MALSIVEINYEKQRMDQLRYLRDKLARFREKLNREKMAKVLMEEAKTTLTPDDPWLQHTWDDVEEWERQGWLSQADAIIKHLTE